MVKANGTVFVVGEELSRDTEAQLRYLWSALQSRGGLSRFSEVRLRDGKRLQENLRASASAVFVSRVPIDLIMALEPELRDRLSRNARRSYEKYFSFENFAENFVNLLMEAISSRKERRATDKARAA